VTRLHTTLARLARHLPQTAADFAAAAALYDPTSLLVLQAARRRTD